jgi:hypothetical protein
MDAACGSRIVDDHDAVLRDEGTEVALDGRAILQGGQVAMQGRYGRNGSQAWLARWTPTGDLAWSREWGSAEERLLVSDVTSVSIAGAAIVTGTSDRGVVRAWTGDGVPAWSAELTEPVRALAAFSDARRSAMYVLAGRILTAWS